MALLVGLSDRSLSADDGGYEPLTPGQIEGAEPHVEVPNNVSSLGDASLDEILQNAAIINLSKLSFADFGTLQSDGAMNVADYLSPEQYRQMTSQLGYDPSFSWKAGDSVASLMNVSDLSTHSTLANWSLTTVAEANAPPGQVVADVGQTALSHYKLPFKGNLEDLVDALPITGNLKVRDVRPIFDWARQKLGSDELTVAWVGGQTISRFAKNNRFNNLTFDNFDFSSYTVDEIPGLKDASFSDFKSFEQAKVTDIPNLATTPFQKYVSTLGEYYNKAMEYAEYLNLNWVPIARVDVVYGHKEGNQQQAGRKSVSGSNVAGYAVVCGTNSCPYIELTDIFGLKIPLFGVHGKAWFDGYHTPWVPGGTGMFTGIPEPTGRHPASNFFKVVITNTSESDGRADLGINGRVCFWWGIQHCTPYVIGPAPFLPVYEGGYIILGLDYFGNWGQSGGISGGSGLSASQQELLKSISKVAPEVYTQIEKYATLQNGSSGSNSQGSDVSDCTSVGDVSMNALQRAIARKESGGQSNGGGDYYAVGTYVNLNGRERGHALGKYQYMTYREDVVPYFQVDAEGRQILNNAANGYYNHLGGDPRLKAAIKKYFPPAAQERLRSQDFRNLVNAAIRLGRRGDAVIAQVATWHYVGPNFQGSINNAYANDVVSYYKQEQPQTVLACAQSPDYAQVQTGGGAAIGKCPSSGVLSLKVPVRGVETSPFGWRFHPIKKRRQLHEGQDYGAPTGTPVWAAATGQVVRASHKGGYGQTVDIKHCNGWITRYAHLSRINVKKNQVVEKGVVLGAVGSTGVSTGPHLHFEVRVNGGTTAVNPKQYLRE